MFEWLETEIASIKTRKFHVVDGPADEALRQAVAKCDLPIPRSYKEFVLRFGNARFYRELSYYKVGVLACPKEERYKEDGESFYRFGHNDSNGAYFKQSLFREGEETPVFEAGNATMHRVADGFEAWLTKRCKAARGKYKKRQWAAIVAGPPPFTPEEQRIVEARRQFACRAVGVTRDGAFLFEVTNGSRMILPFLSVGLRSKDNSLKGGIWLGVSHVCPGRTAIVEHEVYTGMSDPSAVQVFVLPDPEPEDRAGYWEFKE